MRGLTQYQLKFPGPFSTDFKDSRSDTSYNGLRLTRTCRARGHYTRDWAGKVLTGNSLWGRGRQVIPKSTPVNLKGRRQGQTRTAAEPKLYLSARN